jgi:DNA repair exonuclease SbcCD nuclease subunit
MILGFSSDMHFSNQYPTFAQTGTRGVSSRLQEILDVDQARHRILLEHGVRHSLRAGDLFDRRNAVDSVTLAEVTGALRQYQHDGIEEILLLGNHDLASGGVRHSLEMLATAGLAQVFGHGLQTWRGDDVVLHMLAYHESPEVLEGLIADGRPVPGKMNILVAHLNAQGAQTGSEFLLPYTLTLDQLQLEKWDFVILGHVHHPQKLHEKVLYIGSLCQRSFADEGEGRSVVFVDTVTGSVKRHPLPGPRFRTWHLKTEDDLQRLAPDANTYVMAVIETPAITPAAVMEVLADQAKGFVVRLDIRPEVHNGVPRLKPQHSWLDVCCDYLEQTTTPLDKQQLQETARMVICGG